VILPIVVVLIGSFAGFAYWRWTRSPTYSLRQIAVALDNHDVATFEKYVDVKSVASRLIDDVMAKALKENGGADSASALGTAFGAGLVQLMKPRLAEVMEEQASRFVETGRLDESQNGSAPAGGSVSLKDLKEKLVGDKGTFTGLKGINQDGKIATASLGFANERLKSDYVLDLKMRDMGGYWQLVELSNLGTVLGEMQAAEKKRLDDLNAPIRQRIAKAILVGETHKLTEHDEYGINKKVTLVFNVLNGDEEGIAKFEGTARVFDFNGEVVKELGVRSDEPLNSHDARDTEWEIKVNPFIPGDQRLYDLPESDARLELEIRKIVFQNGLELKVLTSDAEQSNHPEDPG
jgi:hypothetical protein